MKLSLGLKIGCSAWLAHFALVICGAFGVEMPESMLGRALSYYSEMSGAAGQWGFFAPGVTSQIDATFDVVDGAGRHLTARLNDGANREVDLRLSDIIEQFLNDDREDEDPDPAHFTRALAASLSAAVFSRHKDAKSVTIRLVKFEPVSMADYRSGVRPTWQHLYSGEFINTQNVVGK